MSIFNRGHLFALITAVAVAGCSSTTEESTSAESGVTSGTTTGQVDGATTDTSAAASLLGQRVVYFDFDKSAIRADAYEALQAHAQYLSGHPNAKIRLEGHADERGTREYNMALGERRAKSVVSFLTANGASGAQFEVVSFGEERPAVDGHEEGSWAQNRRAELVYTAEAP